MGETLVLRSEYGMPGRGMVPKSEALAFQAKQKNKKRYKLPKKVTKGSWVQDPETGKLIPRGQYRAPTGKGDGLQVVSDIEPYQSQIDGSTITSRRWHRQHLKNNGCIEIGNESQAHLEANKPKMDSPRETLTRIYNEYTA